MDIERYCRMRKKIAVAYSGGIDSIYLAHMIAKYADVTAYFVKTEFQPQYELEDAKKAAAFSNIPLKIIDMSVTDNASIAANDANRCYYCKKAMFLKIVDAAYEDGYDNVADGTNASDDIADRPGMRALKELGIESPLRICGITKAEVRQAAKAEGIPFWDKPSNSCLATRLEQGTPISSGLIRRVNDVEVYLHDEGFSDYRVRIVSDRARLQLRAEEFGKFFRKRDVIAAKMMEYFSGAELDLTPRPSENMDFSDIPDTIRPEDIKLPSENLYNDSKAEESRTDTSAAGGAEISISQTAAAKAAEDNIISTEAELPEEKHMDDTAGKEAAEDNNEKTESAAASDKFERIFVDPEREAEEKAKKDPLRQVGTQNMANVLDTSDLMILAGVVNSDNI